MPLSALFPSTNLLFVCRIVKQYSPLFQLFLACLCNLQNESLLYEVDTDKLFSNIQEIYAANLTFWREHVTQMLDASRSSRQPLDPTLLTDAFCKVSQRNHNANQYWESLRVPDSVVNPAVSLECQSGWVG